MDNLIGNRIKTQRRKQQLTQEELVRKIDISYATLSKIETGAIKNPSIKTIQKIANGLGLTVDSLIN